MRDHRWTDGHMNGWTGWIQYTLHGITHLFSNVWELKINYLTVYCNHHRIESGVTWRAPQMCFVVSHLSPLKNNIPHPALYFVSDMRLLLPLYWSWWRHQNGNIFRITGPLWGEFTVHWWIPLTKASDAELWGFSLICMWINGWVNNREAGYLRCHWAHYDVTLMVMWSHYSMPKTNHTADLWT